VVVADQVCMSASIDLVAVIDRAGIVVITVVGSVLTPNAAVAFVVGADLVVVAAYGGVVAPSSTTTGVSRAGVMIITVDVREVATVLGIAVVMAAA